jgi:uncharacterized protein (TIGR03437 family)
MPGSRMSLPKIAVALCFATSVFLVHAQTAPAAILKIEIENYAAYVDDATDSAKLASDPSAAPSSAAGKTFATFLGIADIVAVNGKPAKGTWVVKGTRLNMRPDASAGKAIADTTRSFLIDSTWEIEQADGTPIGTIVGSGLAYGPPQPGAPQAFLPSAAGATAIVGGTGAFLGVRGQAGFTARSTGESAARTPSTTEDPANRRERGGGAHMWLVHLIPMGVPVVASDEEGPLVIHASDFSRVTSESPAKAGETLTVAVSNLGPTNPGVEPGEPFDDDPLQEVNSPVELSVNGSAVELTKKIGWPGTTNLYMVDFQVPAGIASGTASLRFTAAFVPGIAFQLPVGQ